jgi:ABC-type Fe3+/spermidine/putrescine transport system ATPase subunit
MYRRPNSRFVADFLGDTNFLPAILVESRAGDATYKTAAGNLRSTVAPFPKAAELSLSLRPEALRLVRGAGAAAGENLLAGTVRSSIYLGDIAQHEVELDGLAGASGASLVRVAELNPKNPPAIGERVALEIDADDVVPLAS